MEIKSGIYKITCTGNGKIYIGSASNLKRRFKEHRSTLKNNTHCNTHLQNSYNKYGVQSFIYEVLEYVEDTNLLVAREQYYIDTTLSYKHCTGFNINPKAGSCLGRKLTEEHKAKIGKASKRNLKGRKLSLETCRKISESSTKYKLQKTYYFVSPNGENIEIKGLLKFCRKHNLSHAGMISVAHGKVRQHKGWTKWEEKENGYPNYKPISRAKTHCFISPDGKQVTITNLVQFCKQHNLTNANMYKVIKGEIKSHKGWQSVNGYLPRNQFFVYFQSPIGEVVKTDNISKTSQENGLNISTMCKVAKGLKKQHKGWSRYNPEPLLTSTQKSL